MPRVLDTGHLDFRFKSHVADRIFGISSLSFDLSVYDIFGGSLYGSGRHAARDALFGRANQYGEGLFSGVRDAREAGAAAWAARQRIDRAVKDLEALHR